MREGTGKLKLRDMFSATKMRNQLFTNVGYKLTNISFKKSLSHSSIGVFLVFLIIAGDFWGLAVGQSSSDTNSTSSCVCGVDRVPCAKSLTSSDCPNGRVISRRDCPCCFVCAKQLTEECNMEEMLCDSDYGLECGSDKHCKGMNT